MTIQEIKEHVLVNNWANGWIFARPLNPANSVRVVFIPQILEYVGMAAFIIWIRFIAEKKVRSRINDE